MNEPDLLQLDAANRERALDLTSFIVEAPAGAGKTELLTQRYLKLLAVVREPEEIVAITFTNKAAAEMRGRVLQSLQDAHDAVPVTQPHKRTTRQLAEAALARSGELGWALLDQPGRLRINTIDSLCSMLARQMPLMSRFGAQPAVSEDASVHYREAARRAIAMLEDEEGEGAVTEALRYLDNDTGRLAALLADMLSRRDQWLHHAGRTSAQEEAKAALRHLVEHDIRRAAEVLDERLQRSLMQAARYAASNLPCDHPVSLLLDWETPVRPVAEALPMWRALCDMLLTSGGECRKERGINIKNGFPATEEGKAYKQMLLDVIVEIADPQTLARLRSLPDLRNHDEEWRIVGNLARLLQLGAAHLTGVFQEAGEVDFVEISTRALQALEDETGPTELAMRLDYRIQHLLVDEFQDTSPAQVALLERLTLGWEPDDGRTIFCVGDPMQSIYRFRKADVGLFLHVAEAGIGHLALERLHLTRNNRSCPAVVDWVNDCFAHVFPQHDSVTRGAISYRRFAATREPMPGEGVLVHALASAAGAGTEALALLEAIRVADLIEQERREYPGRPIAVLVRARSHLEALVAEIRRNRPQLKFQAVEIECLGGRQAVQDAMALTRAMLHRADRVHWLAILRAPWCGLTLADLHALAADDTTSTVWRLMQDEERVSRLSEDGQRRLKHVRAALEGSFTHQGRQPLRRWVESAWLRLAGPECLWEAGDVRDVQAYFDLIEDLDNADTFDPDQLEIVLSELYAAPDAEADGSLQFMTLHKSKGLEFDTVILPGLHRQPKNTDSQLLLWEDVQIDGDAPQLVAAPWVPRHLRDDLPTPYDYLRGLECERSANESARVLYVGATRAIRRLHLVGAVCLDAKGEVKPPAGSFLELLWGAVGGEFLHAAESPLPPPEQRGSEDFVPQLIRLPEPRMPEILVQSGGVAGGGNPHEIVRGRDQGSLEASCGTLAHLYMEMIAREGIARWNVDRLQQLQPAMRAWLQRQGHNATEADEGAATIGRNLVRTLESEHGRWVLQTRDDAQAEYALATAEESKIATHVMDRTFVEDGQRWIVDYKSAWLGEGVGDAALKAFAEQYRVQLERYAGLFAEEELPVRKAVFFLAHARLVEL
jgi:ATP-dependent helicase/nuclease subunit A